MTGYSDLLYIPVKYTGAGMKFQFLTSGYPLLKESVTSGGFTFDMYKGAAVLSSVQGDTIIPAVREGRRFDGTHNTTFTQRRIQVQLQDEPVGYANALVRTGKPTIYRDSIYTTYAPNTPYSGIYRSSLNFEKPACTNTQPGYKETDTLRDVGVDTPFAYGERSKNVINGVLGAGSTADWPRCSGMQTVEGRKFAVYITAEPRVYIFPVDKIDDALFDDDPTQNVDPADVRSVAIVLPTGAFIPTAKAATMYGASPGNWFANAPDFSWKMNHLGTKACCVYHEREAVTWDTGFISDPDTKIVAVHGNFANHGISSSDKTAYLGHTGTLNMFDATSGSVSEMYTYGRGIFELDINISYDTTTKAYSVDVTPHTIRAPRTSDRGTFMVDYAWQDMPDADVQRGDMMILDIERWYQPDESVAEPTPFIGIHMTTIARTPSIVTACNPTTGELTYIQPTLRVIDGVYDFVDGVLPDLVTTIDGFDFHLFQGTRPKLNISKWSEEFVTGDSATFFSLRRRRGISEEEITAIAGDCVLGVSLKTGALAIGLEAEQAITRTVSLATVNQPTATTDDPTPMDGYTADATMPYKVSHPGVAIYTQCVLREVLTPPGMDVDVVAALQTTANSDPRADYTDYTYMPANDLADWSGHGPLRDFQMYMNNLSYDFPARLPTDDPFAATNPLHTVTVAERNWWLAMCAYSSNLPLLLVSNPNFGWALYTSEAIHRAQNVNVTFFSHPNGSWAFYDSNRIYNKYGVPDVFPGYTAANRHDHTGKYSKCPYVGAYFDFNSSAVTVEEFDPPAYYQMRKHVADGGGPVATYVRTKAITRGFGYDNVFSYPDDVHPGAPPLYNLNPNPQAYGPDMDGFYSYPGIPFISDPITLYVDVDGTILTGHTTDSISYSLGLITNIWNAYDTLTPALGQVANFQHWVCDRIHLQKVNGRGVLVSADNTFQALYNEAADRLPPTGTGDALNQLTTALLKGTATLSANHSGVSADSDAGPSYTKNYLKLNINLSNAGTPVTHDYTVTDTTFKDYFLFGHRIGREAVDLISTLGTTFPNADTNLGGFPPGGGGSLLKYRMERTGMYPPTFSTCMLLDL